MNDSVTQAQGQKPTMITRTQMTQSANESDKLRQQHSDAAADNYNDPMIRKDMHTTITTQCRKCTSMQW